MKTMTFVKPITALAINGLRTTRDLTSHHWNRWNNRSGQNLWINMAGLSRNLCTLECSLVQLSADIDFIYQDLTDNEFSLSRYRLAVIQQKILSGLYVLSPLLLKNIKKANLLPFLYDLLPDCPDIMLGTGSDSDIIYVVMPENKEDVLVLMGLSLMLFRLSHGRLPKDGFRLENLDSSFYYSLQQMGKVDRVYKLDLIDSLRIIPISLILDKVKPFVGDGSIYKLISSLLCLPIIDENGNNRSDISNGIPPVGEITRVLFDIVLMDIFDREFRKRFPGIAFSRFNNEVLISTRGHDEVIFDDQAGYALLEELGLVGKIVSIGPGDDPLMCFRNLLFLDSNSQVQVSEPLEFFGVPSPFV